VTEKTTAFDRATGSSGDDIIEGDGEEQRQYVPRAVFTKDATLDVSKIQVSQLRIAQGSTEEVRERKASIGQFVLSNFPAHDKVVLVPLGAQDIRQYKPDPKKPPMCQAPTGDFGFGNPGGPCELCPLSHWGEFNEVTQKSTPPKCKEGVTVRFYSLTHRCLVDFQFLAGERSKGSFLQQQAMSFGWAGFAIEMSTQEKSNPKGSWFVTNLVMLDDIPEDQKGTVAKWYEVFLAGQVESKQSAIQALSSGHSSS
jgi:hypothetical protein